MAQHGGEAWRVGRPDLDQPSDAPRSQRCGIDFLGVIGRRADDEAVQLLCREQQHSSRAPLLQPNREPRPV
jgi:hypothetical protein